MTKVNDFMVSSMICIWLRMQDPGESLITEKSRCLGMQLPLTFSTNNNDTCILAEHVLNFIYDGHAAIKSMVINTVCCGNYKAY